MLRFPRPDVFHDQLDDGETCWQKHATSEMTTALQSAGKYVEYLMAQAFMYGRKVR